jgi:hypothetical protein
VDGDADGEVVDGNVLGESVKHRHVRAHMRSTD